MDANYYLSKKKRPNFLSFPNYIQIITAIGKTIKLFLKSKYPTFIKVEVELEIPFHKMEV